MVPRAIRRTAVGAVVIVVLSMLAHTFVAIGWLRPIVVQGSSMAPTYHGEHRVVACEDCGSETDTDELAKLVRCPDCGGDAMRVSALRSGDRIPLVKRSSLAPLRRWNTAVLQSPVDARELLIKRLLGLPGERVQIEEGDLLIDSRRVAKEHADQLALRVPVFDPRELYLAEGESWRSDPVTDDLLWNTDVTRRLNPVSDLMVEFVIESSTAEQWRIEIAGRCLLEIGPSGEARLLDVKGELLHRIEQPDAKRWTLSSFDHAVLLAEEGNVIFQAPLEAVDGSAAAFVRIAAIHGDLSLRELSLWRDVYYENPAGGAHSEGGWRLGDDEWFVAGDNQAVSRDSRHWPNAGVPGRLIVGSP